jgi:hypothetical protein
MTPMKARIAARGMTRKVPANIRNSPRMKREERYLYGKGNEKRAE